MASANPRELALVAWTLAVTEAEAHRKLRSAKIRAEWFAICPPVLRLVGRFDWLDAKVWGELWERCEPGMVGRPVAKKRVGLPPRACAPVMSRPASVPSGTIPVLLPPVS
jgi:hypothetical protein